MKKELFAVVDKDGEFVVRKGGRLAITKRLATAERWAVWEGDSVIELTFDTDRTPLFIRRKTLVTKP